MGREELMVEKLHLVKTQLLTLIIRQLLCDHTVANTTLATFYMRNFGVIFNHSVTLLSDVLWGLLEAFPSFRRIITIPSVDPPQDLILKHLWSFYPGPKRGSVGPLRATASRSWTRWTCCPKSICRGCTRPPMRTDKKPSDVFGSFYFPSALLSWWLKLPIEFATFYRNQLVYKWLWRETTV